MKLFHRFLGGVGRPLLILHGLFGSSKNWVSNGKVLTQYRKVYLLDLRNHGDSPHSDSHSLPEMVEDLREFVETLDEKPDLLGHSMGGMVSSLHTLQYPELTRGLVVVDIAPRTYPVRFGAEFEALEMDVSRAGSRQEIDGRMSELLPDPFLRQFLQMNLEKTDTGYRWKIHVDALKRGREASLEFPNSPAEARNPALFILGEQSEYVLESDSALIRSRFPNVEIVTIPGGGHYLHYFQAETFLEQCGKFFQNF